MAQDLTELADTEDDIALDAFDVRYGRLRIVQPRQERAVCESMRRLGQITPAVACRRSPATSPVLLDAECAWWGDPAFDLAFCLNHLLLKCLWRPQWWARYLDCFSALYGTYLGRVTWESRDGLEARIARLLPGLFLARVDGKSPAEYITEEADRDRVRRVACQLLLRPVDRLSHVSEAWRTEVGLDPRSLH